MQGQSTPTKPGSPSTESNKERLTLVGRAGVIRETVSFQLILDETQ